MREGETDLERGDIDRRGDLERDFPESCDREGDCARAIEVGVCDLVRDRPRDCASGDMAIEDVVSSCTSTGGCLQSASEY